MTMPPPLPSGSSPKGHSAAIAVIASVVGVLVVAALSIFVVVPALTPDEKVDTAANAVAATAAPGAPSRATASGGFSLGRDGVAGTATEGAVQVDVYLDFMCPICGIFEETNTQALDELRADGDITLVMHPVSILDRMSQGTQYSTRSAAAAAYIAENAPEKFLAFSTALMAAQPEEGTAGLNNAQIADIARESDVPGDVAAAVEDGTAFATYGSWVAQVTRAASADPMVAGSRGFGTPTILVNGEQFMEDWSDPTTLPAAIKAAAQ